MKRISLTLISFLLLAFLRVTVAYANPIRIYGYW